MRQLSFTSALLLLAPFAAAQNCFNGDFGTLLATGPNDVVLPIQSIGFPFPVGGTTYTDLHITDHGYVQLSNGGVPAPATTPQIYTPTTTNFTAGSAKVCALYADIVGGTTGRIYLRSTPTHCTVTWRDMQNFGLPTPRFDFQLTLFPNGDVRIVFGANVTNNSTFTVPSDNGICGITPGGNATLPAPLDLSAGGSTVDPTVFEAWTVPMTFDLQSRTLLFVATSPGYTVLNLGAPSNCAATSNYGAGCDGLSMTGIGLPSIGNSNFTLRISGVPAVSPVAFVGFGDTVVNPGTPLGIIGMAGCSGYTNLNIGLFTSGPVASGVSDFVLAIPNSPAIVGTLLSSQGLSLTTATALGLNASNGTQVFVGFGN